MTDRKPSRQVVEVLNAKQSDSKAFRSKFQILNNEVTHQNRIDIELTQEKTPELYIKNFFANIAGNQLLKITEIHLEDRVVRIIDTFTSSDQNCILKESVVVTLVQEPAKQAAHHRNLLQNKARISSNDIDEVEVKTRDTKNVVKNIYRLFQNWVEEKCPSAHQRHLTQELRSLLEQNGKYNNKLIIRLSNHSELRKYFMTFSDDQGEKFIGRSKINDKGSHLQALKKYRRICNEEKAVAQYEQYEQNNHSCKQYGATDKVYRNISQQKNKLQYKQPVPRVMQRSTNILIDLYQL